MAMMSRPKRWSKALSDAMIVLSDERERLEEVMGENGGAGDVKLTEAAADAVENAISEVESIKEEYEEWKDNFPENAQNSPTYQKLEEVVDLDTDFDRECTFDEAQEKLEELDGVDLPRGFGRD